MDWISLIGGLILGGIVGFLIAHFAGKARVEKVHGQLDVRMQAVNDLTLRIEGMNERIDVLNTELKEEGQNRVKAESKLEDLQDQVKFIEEAKKTLGTTFKALSSDVLNTSNEAFLKLAKSTLEKYQTEAKGDLTERQKAIENLVKPMKENLDKYQTLITEMSKEHSGQYLSLKDQIKALLESELSLKTETSKLVTALSSPKVRGRWGELTLKRVAELAGMVERCDFYEQETVDTEDGKLRPDMMVNLPNGRRIVVDAKAPLAGYLEAVDCATEEDRSTHLKKYASHVKKHCNDLSKKEYWDQFDEAPEFVVMFLPGEQFLGAALQEDPGLLEDAFRQKVILATPATLIALLKAVAYGWRQEALEENAKQISELGKELYERLAVMIDHFQNVGKNLDRSLKAYNEAVGSLNTRVIVSGRKFKELGVSSPKEIPDLEKIDTSTRSITPIGYDVTPPEDKPSAQA